VDSIYELAKNCEHEIEMLGPHSAKPEVRDAVEYLTEIIKRKEIRGYHGTKTLRMGRTEDRQKPSIGECLSLQ
jgi:hypothetical protein